jgi:hypothetical protein
MNEFVLRGLGASGEQIERERDRIRDELFGSPLAIEILLPPPPRPAVSDGQVAEQAQPREADETLPKGETDSADPVPANGTPTST